MVCACAINRLNPLNVVEAVKEGLSLYSNGGMKMDDIMKPHFKKEYGEAEVKKLEQRVDRMRRSDSIKERPAAGKNNEAFREEARCLYSSGMTVIDVEREMGITRNTTLKYLKGILREDNFEASLKNYYDKYLTSQKNDYKIINDDYAIVFAISKGIIHETKVDLDDLNKVVFHTNKWAVKNFKGTIYISCNAENGVSGLLHRFIMGDPKGMVIDHINGDTLDNRKGNLRISTNAENSQNTTKLNKSNTVGFPHVTYNKNRNKWMVQMIVNKVKHHLGYFTDVEEAKVAAAKARLTLIPHAKLIGDLKYYEEAKQALKE